MKSLFGRDICTSVFTVAFCAGSRFGNKLSAHRWMNIRKCGVCVCIQRNAIHHQKEGNPAFATTQIDREHDANSEEKDKCCMISLLCGILKKKMQSLRDRAQTDGCQTWGVVKMGEGGQTYKLPVIR